MQPIKKCDKLFLTEGKNKMSVSLSLERFSAVDADGNKLIVIQKNNVRYPQKLKRIYLYENC